MSECGLLQRVDERTVDIRKDIVDLRSEVIAFNREVKNNYVTRREFKPVKALVYGVSGAILLGVVGALLASIGVAG